MGQRLYVGNLPFTTSEAALRAAFAEHDEVVEVHLVMDRDTGRPRGFGFVTMASPAGAQKAIASMNGQLFDGRQLNVNEAEERQSRGGGGGGGSGGGGGGFGGRRNGGTRNQRW